MKSGHGVPVPINPTIEFKVFLDFRPQLSAVSNQTEYPSINPCWHGSGSFEPSKLRFSAIFCEAFGKSHPLIIRQDENSKQQLWLLWNYWYKDKILFLYHWLEEKFLLDEIQHYFYFPNTLWVESISISYQYQTQNCPCFISLEDSEKNNFLVSKPSFLSLPLGVFFVQELFSCLKKLLMSLANTLP